VTLIIGRIFVRELADSYELNVTADGAPEFTGFHWQPSSRFRVHLVSRNRLN
jgi:hypothetical protein